MTPNSFWFRFAANAELPYRDFHTGYKKTRLAADELIRADLPFATIFRIFFLHAQSWSAQCAGDFQSMRCGTGPCAADGVIEDVRIAVGKCRTGADSSG